MAHVYSKFNFVLQCWNIISLFDHFDRFPDPGPLYSTSLVEIGDLQPIGTLYKSDSSGFARRLNYSGCAFWLFTKLQSVSKHCGSK